MSRLTGTVKFFNQHKGFGFIQDQNTDYFVHITDVDGEMLLDNEEVTFKPVQGHKGMQAIEVERVAPPALEGELGHVKFYDDAKGYGFISREGKADVFAHFSDIENNAEMRGLEIGEEVSFVVREGREGRDRAYKINRKS